MNPIKCSSKEIAIPNDVNEQYKEYCRITKMKLSEPLRVMILESLPLLHNAQNLDQIIYKTKNMSNPKEFSPYFVRLSEDALVEINAYCKFFRIPQKRRYFMYFLIEEKLKERIKDVLNNG